MLRYLLVISTAFVCIFTKCDVDWAEFDGECIYFSHDRRSYLDAENDCRKRDAYLASIDNANKSTFVQQVLSVMHSNRYYKYYIGGSDFAIENSWRWLETGKTIGPFSNWADGRPLQNGTLNCISMEWIGDQVKWVDASCYDRSTYYICEKQMTA